MKATESPFIALLNGPKQFLIPIYQRTYSWQEDQCAQLWDDVLRIAQDERFKAHFIGSVVYIERGIYQATTVPQLLVIDGQQRLTTISLMIEALARALDKREVPSPGGTTSRKLRNYCLLNADEDGDRRYKLQLSKGDTETYRALLDNRALPERAAQQLVDNLDYFVEQVEAASVSPEDIYHGLQKLLVVDVSLDRDNDNPQLIFESLNSTGLDLSQSDLIRNFVLMGLEPAQQDELYKKHWEPMENVLAGGEKKDTFDRFLRAWLAFRTREVPSLRQGYETFKSYRAGNPDQPIDTLVADLHRFADYYGAIALGREQNPELARVFVGLRALRVDAPVPFLLHAYAMWDEGKLSVEELIGTAKLMESWLFRRAVCEIPSNVLSRTFATMSAQVDDSRFLESLSAYLYLRSGKQRFPRDEEFHSAMASRNMYEFKHLQYCLTRLENHGRKEPVAMAEYQVEHVMPQNENLNAEWREMLGEGWQEVQERCLHTLGNLTLTGYNPELSDRPFLAKRDMVGGFSDSPLRLNQGLGQASTWNEAAIGQRGDMLARKAASIWGGPKVSEDVVEAYREQVSTAKARMLTFADLSHWGLPAEAIALCDVVEAGAAKLGLVPTIKKYWIAFGLPDAGQPYPIKIRKRKGPLRADFWVLEEDRGRIPACGVEQRVKDGWIEVRAKLSRVEDAEACVQVLPYVYGLVGQNLAFARDDEDGDYE